MIKNINKYLKWQADSEIDFINQEYLKKKERQNKYLTELQVQEKQQKSMKRDWDLKMSEREKMINQKSNGKYRTSSPQNYAGSVAKSSENLGSRG